MPVKEAEFFFEKRVKKIARGFVGFAIIMFTSNFIGESAVNAILDRAYILAIIIFVILFLFLEFTEIEDE